jgi:hypothetical protein
MLTLVAVQLTLERSTGKVADFGPCPRPPSALGDFFDIYLTRNGMRSQGHVNHAKNLAENTKHTCLVRMQDSLFTFSRLLFWTQKAQEGFQMLALICQPKERGKSH